MGSIILISLIAFFSMFIPGILLAFALLKNTKLGFFEISVIGFIFGLIAPATMTWLEAYLANYIHFFSFSLALFEANAAVLSVIGLILCIQQGVFTIDSLKRLKSVVRVNEAKSESAEISSMEKDYKKRLEELRARLGSFEDSKAIIKKHLEEENALRSKQSSELEKVSFDEEEKAKLEKLHREELERLALDHEQEEKILLKKLSSNTKDISSFNAYGFLSKNWVWLLLLLIMLLTFATRMQSIGIAPKFFEFDPYFDMLSAQSILTFGHQLLYSPSAWPTIPTGTIMRIQPIVPYLEAYWYSLANSLGPHLSTFSTSLMSYVSGVYPPITAALLVFVIFMLLYHEYDKYIALIGASLVATMPVIFSTFVAGEQLLEPWGIFTLFFFFAAYMLAVKNMKSKRLAIFAGIAFASTFLGAHYYTVDTGVLTLYILIQGIVSLARRDLSKDFYKMNAIVLVVIGIFLAVYHPYHATLSGRIPNLLGLPITIGAPLFALILIAIMDYIPKILHKNHILFKRLDSKTYLEWIVLLIIIVGLVMLLTPIGKPITAYINLSKKFTTPSSPLFMTVQEFIPTGLAYNFAAQGFGIIGASIGGLPLSVWIISALGIIMLLISIIFRNSKTGIFYLAIVIPLMVAGFSEVKYMPHFGVAFILLFSIIIGEIFYLAKAKFKLQNESKLTDEENSNLFSDIYKNNKLLVYSVFAIALFFISTILAVIFLLVAISFDKVPGQKMKLYALTALFVIIIIISTIMNHSVLLGESSSITNSISAYFTNNANPSAACSVIDSHGNSIGADLYCNVVPSYWLTAAQWMAANIGPYAPRVLAWWDYGDWINWFGHSNAVIRGDNANALEDYAVAADYVLGPKDGFNSSVMANMMNTNETKYIVMDQGLIQKWQALDFLACVHTNATSEAYAIAQGHASNPPVPYALGNSPCEIAHDPEFAVIPLPALLPQNSSTQSLSYYCSMSNSTTQFVKTYLVHGNSLSNSTICVDTTPNSNGVLSTYDANGTKLNAVLQSSELLGEVSISNIPFLEYLMIYLPNAPNNTITDAPSQFYNSSFYKGFFFGTLPGFKQVYPANATGINFVNGTYPIRILALDNFTGKLPPVPSKPSYVHNNLTMP